MRWHIVIVNYRTGPQAAAAARGAQAAVGSRGTVTVVDNASGDDSCGMLASIPNVELLALADNRGFGSALNAGSRGREWDILLGCNADVTLAPGLPAAFERRFDLLERLGILGPRLLNADGTPQPSCRSFPTHARLLAAHAPLLVRRRHERPYVPPEPPAFSLCDVVAGACMAVRRATWEELGGMDEQFFLYAEDTDLCRRAKSAGWLVGYEPAVSVRHEWRASTAQDRRRSNLMHVRSLAKYFAKHFPERSWANRGLHWVMRAYVMFRPGA